MLDLSAFDDRRLAGALLRKDHGLLTEAVLDDQWIDGEVEEVETESRAAGRWEVSVNYSGICNDETEAFRSGTVVASSEVQPGENDQYRSSIVVLFKELIDGHHVILEGDQGGAGGTDESHEAWMIGTITVVPEAEGAETLSLALGRQRRDLMHDVRINIDKQVARLHDATNDEMRDNGVTKAFGELARLVARAA